MWNILAGLSIFVIAVVLCIYFKCQVEKTLAIVVMGIIAFLYFFSLLGFMRIGFFILIAISAISLICCFFKVRKNNISQIVSLGSIYYWIGIILACIQNKYRVVNTMGDLIQRAMTPKYSYVEDMLFNASGRSTIFMEYPPATSLFYYYWMKIGTSFQDNRLYISMAVLMFVLMIPVLEEVSKKRRYIADIVISILLYISVFSFYPNAYCDLAVDCLMGICFAYILFMECYEKHLIIKRLSISLALFVLILTKSSGIIFAVFALIIIFIRYFMQREKKDENQKDMYAIAWYIGACAIAKVSWEFYIKYLNISPTFGVSLESDKLSELAEWQKQGFVNYFKAIFDYKVIDDYSSTFYYLGNNTVSCIVWIGVLIFFTVVICWIKKSKIDTVTFIQCHLDKHFVC